MTLTRACFVRSWRSGAFDGRLERAHRSGQQPHQADQADRLRIPVIRPLQDQGPALRRPPQLGSTPDSHAPLKSEGPVLSAHLSVEWPQFHSIVDRSTSPSGTSPPDAAELGRSPVARPRQPHWIHKSLGPDRIQPVVPYLNPKRRRSASMFVARSHYTDSETSSESGPFGRP